MSDATRAVALTEAVKVMGPEGDAASILYTAKAFNDFLTADSTPVSDPKPAVTSVAGKEPTQPAKPTKGSVSKAKPATKILVPETEADTPEGKAGAQLTKQMDEQEDAEPETDDEHPVKLAIAQLLANNLRKEAVALLKKYKAASFTSVKEKDYAAFIADAKKLLPSESEDEDADLTA